MLKPGGLLYFAAPTNLGADALIFNAHRVYGPMRLPLLTANFNVLDVHNQSAKAPVHTTATHIATTAVFGGTDVLTRTQPVIVLQKIQAHEHASH